MTLFRGKKYKDGAKQIDRSVQYETAEALVLVCKTAPAKFDETVEIHIKLGVDSRHADQQVRGAIVLPNGTGKTRKVLVFAKDAKAASPIATAFSQAACSASAFSRCFCSHSALRLASASS